MRHLIKFFLKFRKWIGRRIYFILTLMLIGGFMEGIGITLFFPILQNGFGDDRLSRVMGSVFSFFHIEFSFTGFLLLILIFFILRGAFLISYGWYFGKVSTNLLVTLRKRLMNDIFASDYLYLLKKETGYISNVAFLELERVVSSFNTFSQILNFSLFGLIYAIPAFLLNFKIAAIVVGISPLLMLFMRRFNTLTSKTSEKLSDSHGRFNSATIQALGKLKYLKATMSHLNAVKIIDRENKELGAARFKMSFLGRLSRDIFEPFIVLIVVALIFYYVIIIKRPIGEVIFLVFLFLQISRQFLNAQVYYRKFLSSIGSIDTYNKLSSELKENKEDLHLSGHQPDFTKEFVLRDVKLGFPNGKTALNGVNISIRPKTLVALVGHSGSGKSTLANIITGLLRPTEGMVYLGETSYDSLNLKRFREKIGYVTQEDIIFNATIKENISLLSEDVDMNKFREVLRLAHMNKFVKGLAREADELLGDNGLEISGGQRQRITIARELYKDSELLILDEATSSLDSKYENIIYENIKGFKGKKTIVVIAHRLSTIKNADYIYVMDDGKIIEEGTFDKLYKDRGTEFYQICKLQSIQA